MYRDITKVIEQDCTLIIDDKTLMGLSDDGKATTYKLISNTYYQTQREDYTATPNVSKTCYNHQDLSTLPSQYDFITPIFHTIAILSAIGIFYVAYKLILYPFFRKKI